MGEATQRMERAKEEVEREIIDLRREYYREYFKLVDGAVEPSEENLLVYAERAIAYGRASIELGSRDDGPEIYIGSFSGLEYGKFPQADEGMWQSRNDVYWHGVMLATAIRPITPQAKGQVHEEAVWYFQMEIEGSQRMADRLREGQPEGKLGQSPEFWDKRAQNAARVIEAIYQLAGAGEPRGQAE